ncbi:MAG: tetratricopeptide repeat protein [Salinivirgaceae bacterium]|nr:tetratricopeptide repeat protein [Salinivirgaceae bacterium]
MMAISVVAATLFSFVIWHKSRSEQNSKKSFLVDHISKLIEIADSVRNSKPDTALIYYNQTISLLQDYENRKDKYHLLANSFVGISHVYLETGNYYQAFKNDSIAMVYALECGDERTQAKVFIVRGISFFKLASYDEALRCYEKAEQLAIGIGDLEIQSKIYSNRAMIYFYQGQNQKTIDGFTKALNICKQLNNEPLIASSYMNLAIFYSNQSQNDSVFAYYNYALALFQKINDKNGVLRCYMNLGNAYYGFSDFGKAIEYYQLTIEHALEMDDKSNLAKAYNNIGDVFIQLGDYDTAADLLFKSLKIKEEINDKASLAKGFFGLGKLYFHRKDYLKSLSYFQKSLKINQEIKNIIQIGSNYNSIASIYSAVNRNDSAIFYYNKVMESYKEIDYTYGISNLCINLADEYRLNKKYDQSEKLLFQALQLKTEMKEEEGIATVNLHLSNLYVTQAEGFLENQKNNLLIKAEQAGLRSYKIATRIGTIPVRRDVSGGLKKIYQMQGRDKEALEYFEIYNALSDSLLNKNKIEALIFAEARWNIEKKQLEIDNLVNMQKLDHEIIGQKEIEAKQQKFIIVMLVILFLLAILLITFITLLLRKRRSVLYQKQLSNITILKMQNIRNALSPHFTFNVLNNIWAIIDDRETAKVQFDNLTNLIRRSLINTEQLAIPLCDEIAFVKSFIELQKIQMNNELKVLWNIEDGIDLTQHIPGMMLQIPVENAIKHGLAPKKDNRLLLIDIKTELGFLKFHISDNGLGLQQTSCTTKGTGTGLKVLSNTMHILNQNNSNKMSYEIVNINVEDGSGTKVIIKIPMRYDYILN